MKLSPLSLLIAACVLPVLPLAAQVLPELNYQGRVAVNGTAFTGTGQFRFALAQGFAKLGLQFGALFSNINGRRYCWLAPQSAAQSWLLRMGGSHEHNQQQGNRNPHAYLRAVCNAIRHTQCNSKRALIMCPSCQ